MDQAGQEISSKKFSTLAHATRSSPPGRSSTCNELRFAVCAFCGLTSRNTFLEISIVIEIPLAVCLQRRSFMPDVIKFERNKSFLSDGSAIGIEITATKDPKVAEALLKNQPFPPG